MKGLINWKNEVVEHPDWFYLEDLGGGVVKLTPDPGEVIQEGVPQDEDNLNEMDNGAWEALQAAKWNALHIKYLQDKADALQGEVIRVTLTNTQKYPFNNSKKTVTLGTQRTYKNYTVLTEVIDSTGGGVGDIRISDRLTNAFKLEHTGGASSVVIDCYVQGGM